MTPAAANRRDRSVTCELVAAVDAAVRGHNISHAEAFRLIAARTGRKAPSVSTTYSFTCVLRDINGGYLGCCYLYPHTESLGRKLAGQRVGGDLHGRVVGAKRSHVRYCDLREMRVA